MSTASLASPPAKAPEHVTEVHVRTSLISGEPLPSAIWKPFNANARLRLSPRDSSGFKWFGALERDWCPLLAAKQCGLNTPCPLGPVMVPMCIFGKCEAVVPFAPSCEQMRAMAVKAVQTLVNAADASCRADADCVAAPQLSCAGNCGFGALSKTTAATIADGVTDIEQRICKPFTNIECTVPDVQCPSPGAPRCNAGKCTRMSQPQSM